MESKEPKTILKLQAHEPENSKFNTQQGVKQMKKRKKVWRSYFIDRSFQLKFVCINVLLQFCTATFAGFLFSYLYLFVFTTKKIGCQYNYALFLQWSILIALILIVLIIWGIGYTHRIIGPIYKTQTLLRAAASGKIPKGKISFRKNDNFKELANDLSNCFEHMQKYKSMSFESLDIKKKGEIHRHN